MTYRYKTKRFTLVIAALLFLGMTVGFGVLTMESYVPTKWIPIGLFSSLAFISLIRYVLYTAEIEE